MRMILVCTVLTAILGTTLYQVKIGIDARESQLLTLESQIADTERKIAVLEGICTDRCFAISPSAVKESELAKLLSSRERERLEILVTPASPMPL